MPDPAPAPPPPPPDMVLQDDAQSEMSANQRKKVGKQRLQIPLVKGSSGLGIPN